MAVTDLPARVAIIGLGLIGGSVARALRRHDVHISAFDSNPAALEEALAQDCIDACLETAAVPPGVADVIVICVPPAAASQLLALQQQALAAGAVLTDVCGIKRDLVRNAVAVLPPESLSLFLPGHPIAGTEQNGFAAAKESLFKGCRVILTPLPQTGDIAVSRVSALWRACGAAAIVRMEPEEHDRILAMSSHLPHMLAYSLMAFLADNKDINEVIANSAGGLRDFSRIASSDPRLWLDIAMTNREFLSSDMRACADIMVQLAAALETADKDMALQLLQRAQSLKQSLHVSRQKSQ